MPLIVPDREAVVRSAQAYVRDAVPELDPSVTTRRGWIGGMVKSLGSALHDWYTALKRYGDNEPFPQTASRDFLLSGWWRDITKLDPNPAAPARGRIVLTGTAGSGVSAGDTLQANGNSYVIDAAADVVTQTLAAASLTRTGVTAIFETPAPHFLATGQSITISGATQAQYNGTFIITVTAANEFTYPVAGSPATPATGSPICGGAWGNADITATATGQDSNLDSGATLALASPEPGLNATALATFGGIAGGTGEEDIESYRGRILEALGSDFGSFTADEIAIVAKTVAGVTRVFVRAATLGGTNGVSEGQVKVLFLRDNDANPLPSADEVADVKAVLVATVMPAHMAEEDLTVMSPVRLDVNFTFTGLVPNTASMRRAVEASLKQFFEEQVTVGEAITADAYRCAIFDTFDMEARVKLKSFTLAAPAGTVAVTTDELPFLGTITWPT